MMSDHIVLNVVLLPLKLLDPPHMFQILHFLQFFLFFTKQAVLWGHRPYITHISWIRRLISWLPPSVTAETYVIRQVGCGHVDRPHGKYQHISRLEVRGFPFPAKFRRNLERVLSEPTCACSQNLRLFNFIHVYQKIKKLKSQIIVLNILIW